MMIMICVGVDQVGNSKIVMEKRKIEKKQLKDVFYRSYSMNKQIPVLQVFVIFLNLVYDFFFKVYCHY